MSEEINVKKLTNPEDGERVLELIAKYEEGSPAYGVYYFAERPDHEVVGYLRMTKQHRLISTPDVDLHNIFVIEFLQVEPEYRKRGIGRRLLNLAEEELKRADIEKIYVEALNSSFWEHVGFSPVTKGAVILEKRL